MPDFGDPRNLEVYFTDTFSIYGVVTNVPNVKSTSSSLGLPFYARYENLDDVKNDEHVRRNNEEISKVLKQFNFKDIWCAWGTTIEHRPFLKDCLRELITNFDESYKWFHYDDLTKYGHPRHPLYVSYSKNFSNFDIASYIENL